MIIAKKNKRQSIIKLKESVKLLYSTPPSVRNIKFNKNNNVLTPNKFAENFDYLIDYLFTEENINKHSIAKHLEGDFLAGNYPNNYLPFDFFPTKKLHYSNDLHREIEDSANFFHYDSLSLFDFNEIIEKGLDNIIESLENDLHYFQSKMNNSNVDYENKIQNHLASISLCKSMIKLSENLHAAFSIRASEAVDEEKRRELLNISQNCLTVPKLKANNLHQALQSIWLINLSFFLVGITPSFVRLDKTLHKFIIDENDEEYCNVLLQNFFVKYSAHTNSYKKYDKLFGKYFSPLIRSLKQTSEVDSLSEKSTITLGGNLYLTDEFFNSTTALLMDVFNTIKPSNIRLFIGINKNTSVSFIAKIAEFQKQNLANIFIINDVNEIESIENKCLIEKKALEKCNDFSISVLASHMMKSRFVRVNSILNLKETVLNFLSNILDHQDADIFVSNDFNSAIFKPFLQYLHEQFAITINTKINAMPQDINVHEHPMINICNKYKIDSPTVIHLNLKITNLPEIINILSAIKKWYFETKLISIDELFNVIQGNDKAILSGKQMNMIASQTNLFVESNSELNSLFSEVISTISKSIGMLSRVEKTANDSLTNYIIEASVSSYPSFELIKDYAPNNDMIFKKHLGTHFVNIDLSELTGGICNEVPAKESLIQDQIANKIIRNKIFKNGSVLNVYQTNIKGIDKLIFDLSEIFNNY